MVALLRRRTSHKVSALACEKKFVRRSFACLLNSVSPPTFDLAGRISSNGPTSALRYGLDSPLAIHSS